MLRGAAHAGRARCLPCKKPSLAFAKTVQRAASFRAPRSKSQPPRATRPVKPYHGAHPPPPCLPASSDVTRETAHAIFKARKVPLLASGVVALGLGIYLSLLVSSYLSSSSCQCMAPPEDAVPTGSPTVFTKESARKFDQSLDGSEWLMGITALRQKLAAEASGHVLEVAMGTGRNLAYYDWSSVLRPNSTKYISTAKVPAPTALADTKAGNTAQSPMLSFTGVDISGEMLGVAIEKLTKAIPVLDGVEPMVESQGSPTRSGVGAFSYLSGRLRLVRSDMHDFIPPPAQGAGASSPAPAQYDTVVQTFGLCSVRDPEQVVQNLASVIKPDTGRVILVEHGRGWWGIVNGLLDKSAAAHFQKYGCWWNRDIAEIVENAAKSTPGLEIVKIERPYLTQLGTTLWIELRMKKTGNV